MSCIRINGPGRKSTILCTEVGPVVTPDPECPNVAQHTPHPSGFLRHMDWAEQMLKTHIQQRCEGCGKWNIWVPKVPR